jgi:hypothetical protein
MEFEQHLATHALIDAIICPICNHSEQDIHYFKRHFRLAHPSEVMPSAVKLTRVLRDLALQPCPFCAEIPGSKNFVRHVSRHCEVALSSLSRGAFDEDSHDGDGEEGEEECIGAAKVAIQDDSGMTPLALACQGGNSTIMDYLLKYGADVDDGSLHDAAGQLRCDAIRVLIKHGHDPNYPSERHGGRSALSELCFKAVDNDPSSEDLVEAIRCLIANGADIKQRGLNGKTPFHYALDSSDLWQYLKRC